MSSSLPPSSSPTILDDDSPTGLHPRGTPRNAIGFQAIRRNQDRNNTGNGTSIAIVAEQVRIWQTFNF
ncbi:putative movement protein 1 [Paris virus 2]|nr:putative movement protein 1 [Paris virus 2]